MTLQEIEKAAEKHAAPHYENDETTWGAIASSSFISGANLVMERVRVLEEVLKRISAMPHDGHEESWAGICNCPVGIARAALEGK